MHTVTPYLAIQGAEEAMKFYEKAFGAQITHLLKAPDGKVMHGRLSLGDSQIMVMDEAPQMGCGGPQNGSTSVVLHLNVPDVDSFFARSVEAGMKVIMPVTDMFWGDRYGQVIDPYGHRWSMATPVKELSPAELEAAAAEAFKQMGACSQQPAQV